MKNSHVQPETLKSNFSGLIAQLIDMIINFIVKAVKNPDMRRNFSNLLNNIIQFYNKNGKLDVDLKLIEKISELGSFGKSEYSRRLSAYFTSCIIIVSIIHMKP